MALSGGVGVARPDHVGRGTLKMRDRGRGCAIAPVARLQGLWG